MWSKTKWALEQRLAECLKGRVSYSYTAKRVNHKPWGMDMWVMYIYVDKEIWLATNPNYYDELGNRERFNTNKNDAVNQTIRETGLVKTGWIMADDVMAFIHQYLNVLSVDESLTNDNYFIRLLAVLDGRIGKRRLRPLLDNIDNEPEWFRKWIRLRCEAEGMLDDNK